MLRADDVDNIYFQISAPNGDHVDGDRELPRPLDPAGLHGMLLFFATPALAAIQEAAKSSVPTLGYGVSQSSGIPMPGREILYGVWLVPAVLGALVIRKPGAALFTETVAALVSVALGTGSPVAAGVIEGWDVQLPRFMKVMPHDYKRALAELAPPPDTADKAPA